MKPPILKPWHSVVQPVDQKACVLADIAISKGNGGLDVFNGYRLCFSLHRQATPRERIISTVRIFSEKGKASLSQPAEARSCPLRFRRGKTSHTSGLARRKIFPIPFPVYHILRVCLVDFCRDTSIFLIPCCGGNVPCLCTIQPPTRRQLGRSRRWLFLGSVDEKDTRYKRGHKNFRIKKPVVCKLLTAGLCFHPKNDFFSQARGEKPRFHAGFRHALLLVFSHFPKKMRKSGRAILGRGAGRFKAAAPSRTPPPHCAPHRFPWNPPGAAG